MIKIRNKKIAMVLVLAMLMTMFVGVGAASAASEFRAASTPTVADGTGKTLGTIIVDKDYFDGTKLQEFVVILPNDFVIDPSADNGDQIAIVRLVKDSGSASAGATVGRLTKLSPTRALVTIIPSGFIEPEFVAAVPLNNITVPKSAAAQIQVTLVNQPGSDFTDGLLTVGLTSGGQVQVSAGDPVTVTSAGSEDPVSINFRENKAGAIEVGAKALELKLPKGFSWADDFTFAQVSGTPGNDELIATYTDTTYRTMRIERTVVGDLDAAVIWNIKSNIEVDESVAKFGDVVVTVSGKSKVSPTTVVVGKYSDYGIKVVVDDPETEVIAGRVEQEISDFSIKEDIGASLINNRTVYMTLPAGCRWVADEDGDVDLSAVADGSLSIKDNSITILNNKEETARFTVLNDMMYASKGEIEISNALIDVAVDFTGPVTIEFWGNAGLEDKITVANAVAPVSATADAKEVKIGLQNQAAGDIIITESAADMIMASYYEYGATFQASLVLEAPKNVDWATVPTVEVIEGDLEIDTVTKSNNILNISILSGSSVASKIKISDIKYTVDRTVPEGNATVKVKGTALDQAMFVNRTVAAKVVPAVCVTPAPSETIGGGEFRIGSNIYYVAGVAKVMDVAPYIKGDRTYVPMRYLGEILGAEVVWDATARTVTLTKGDTTVVFTVGSTTYTVNGESKTADVAPEIVNDRTMLPARFVAEAFGALVGWDPATQTVVISK